MIKLLEPNIMNKNILLIIILIGFVYNGSGYFQSKPPKKNTTEDIPISNIICKISLHNEDGQKQDIFRQGETIFFKLLVRSDQEKELLLSECPGPLGEIGRGFKLVDKKGEEYVFYGTPMWSYALIETKEKISTNWKEFIFRFPKIEKSSRILRKRELEKMTSPDAVSKNTNTSRKLWTKAIDTIPPGKYIVFFKLNVVEISENDTRRMLHHSKGKQVFLEAPSIDLEIKK